MKRFMVFALAFLILFAAGLFVFSDTNISYSNGGQQGQVYLVDGSVTPCDVPLLPPDMT